MLKLLGAGMDADSGSEVADKGDLFAHNRTVPSKDPEATVPLAELISTHITGPRCPRIWTAASGLVDVHILTTASFVAEATNSPSGSKATRQTIPDSRPRSPRRECGRSYQFSTTPYGCSV
jgi:hypothetical protein